jgi:DNA-binding NarL/FixJ family response regulator
MKEARAVARNADPAPTCRATGFPVKPEHVPACAGRPGSAPRAGNLDCIDQALRNLTGKIQGLLVDVSALHGLVAMALTESAYRQPPPGPASVTGQRQCPAIVSTKERAVLAQLLEGKSNREISSELGISEKTVKNHLWKIYRKLGVKSRTQLFRVILST